MTSKGYVERRQKIIDAIKGGLENDEIVAAFDCSLSTIKRCRRELGIMAPRGRGNKRKRRAKEENKPVATPKRCERCGTLIVTDSCLKCWLQDGHGDELFKRYEDDEESQRAKMPFDIKIKI